MTAAVLSQHNRAMPPQREATDSIMPALRQHMTGKTWPIDAPAFHARWRPEAGAPGFRLRRVSR